MSISANLHHPERATIRHYPNPKGFYTICIHDKDSSDFTLFFWDVNGMRKFLHEMADSLTELEPDTSKEIELDNARR